MRLSVLILCFFATPVLLYGQNGDSIKGNSNKYLIDSLKNIAVDTIKSRAASIPQFGDNEIDVKQDTLVEGYLSRNLNDTLNLDRVDMEDSVLLKAGQERLRNEVQDNVDLKTEIPVSKEAIKNDSARNEFATSAIEEQVQKSREMQELTSRQSEIQAEQDKMEEETITYFKEPEKVYDKAAIKQRLQSKMTDYLLKNFETYNSVFQKSKEKILKLKNKSIFKKAPADKKAFREQPLSKRLKAGINFQINQGNPLGIDLSPQVSYLVLPFWEAGVGGTYRSTIQINEQVNSQLYQDVIGYRSFIEWNQIRYFYVHGEYELMGVQASAATDREWESHILAGIGRDFKISSLLNGTIQILYNFKHESSTYHKPLLFRFGLELNNNIFKNKKKKKTND